jgi:hypothetical protein
MEPGYLSQYSYGLVVRLQLLAGHTVSGAHPASIQWIPVALSPRAKRPGREAI